MERRSDIHSGILEYKLSGLTKGVTILYFEARGIREARYIKAEATFIDQAQAVDSVRFIESGTIVDVNYTNGTRKNIETDDLSSYDIKLRYKLTQINEEVIQTLKARKIGTKKIAGLTCENWEFPAQRVTRCIWNGVVLEASSNMGALGFQTLTASRAEFNVPIPKDRFVIPDDFK